MYLSITPQMDMAYLLRICCDFLSYYICVIDAFVEKHIYRVYEGVFLSQLAK